MTSIPSRILAAFFALAFLAFVRAPASAMLVDMTTVTLDPEQHVHDIDVLNNDDAPSIVQVDIERWGVSEDNVVSVQPTSDLIVAPKVFTLAPHGTQTVRVAWRSAPTGGEDTFVVKIRQVGQVGSGFISAALHSDFDVFVFATNPTLTKALVSAKVARVDRGHVRVTFENAGQRHAKLGKVSLLREGSSAPAYDDVPFTLLPGNSRRNLTIALPSDGRSHALVVKYLLDGRQQSASFDAE